jgi:excisionase family DNA binding protein
VSATPRPIPRLCYTPNEAAAALGIGRTTFYEQVLPELRTIRLGRKQLVPVRELERWTDRNASPIL